MAADSFLPLYQRPRTPSSPRRQNNNNPPYATPERTTGLGLQHHFDSPTIKTHYDYDVQHGISDSPTKQQPQPESGRTDSASTMLSPAFSQFGGGLSPNGSLNTPITPQTASTDDSGAFEPIPPVTNNPFNFTTTQYVAGKGKSATASDALGKRKGHKYRHSSMHASAMDSIIRSPAVGRTPLAVPASLPVPTRKEIWRSVSAEQMYRLAWCLCHFAIAGYVQFLGIGSRSMTALSRLLVFDAVGGTVRVVVDVMENFEVWKRSSIRHPFGLQRADVLAGFGMAVFVSFMGLDVVTHGIEHSLEDLGTHEAHSPHPHERVTARSVYIASFFAIFSTLVSFLALRNHKRDTPKASDSALPTTSWTHRILSKTNPSHTLTLACSTLILILPVLNDQTHTIYDSLLTLLTAILMITLGVRQGTTVASILLMSYHPRHSAKSDSNEVRDVIADIETEPDVNALEEAWVWQVHYGLCMANLKVRCRAGGDEMERLRQRVMSLVKQRLAGDGSGGGVGGPKWEISVQMGLERD